MTKDEFARLLTQAIPGALIGLWDEKGANDECIASIRNLDGLIVKVEWIHTILEEKKSVRVEKYEIADTPPT